MGPKKHTVAELATRLAILEALVTPEQLAQLGRAPRTVEERDQDQRNETRPGPFDQRLKDLYKAFDSVAGKFGTSLMKLRPHDGDPKQDAELRLHSQPEHARTHTHRLPETMLSSGPPGAP